ncbi:DUF202 domain-containing protein [Sporobolomyces salmoneus]|uniref:DUF202 domain-containing protein n=1 Tax=Sporobolomyces salmoneus TaxID=183962 RepID=UPI00316F0A51
MQKSSQASAQAVPIQRVRSLSIHSEEGGTGWPEGKWYKPLRIPNEGSTARDFLARERNFLSWVKLTIYLIAIFAALLLRFQLGQDGRVPHFQHNAETPLGVLFFVASLGTAAIGTSSYFGVTRSYFQRKGFAYAGKIGDVLLVGIGLLTISTCILLLVAD